MRRITLAAACLLVSCTSGQLYEQEHFGHYGPGGRAQYYRMTIRAQGMNGKMDYHAGWHDAAAVDAVFGNVGAKQSMRAATAERQRQAVRDTFDKYMSALVDDTKSETDIEKAKRSYERALNSVSGSAPVGGDRSSPLDHADEKFVIILSHDPQQVIEAISTRLKQMDIATTFGNLIQSTRTKDTLERKSELGVLIAQVQSFVQSLQEAEGKIDANTKNKALQALAMRLKRELEVVR